eukprot:SAG25_NODE_164_length_13142_cov_11.645787_5_plen_39_part_00
MEPPHCLAGKLVLTAAIVDIVLAVIVTWYNTIQKSDKK